MENKVKGKQEQQLSRERYKLLNRLQEKLEIPMVILGFIWLILLLVELIDHLNRGLFITGQIIWVLFILDFLLKLWIAPTKIPFLKKNVLTIISLIVPAFRIFRILRSLASLRAVRGLRLVKMVGSVNRGMKSLGKIMRKRRLGYVLSTTICVMLIGAGGMYAFEKNEINGLNSYWAALWWTAMLMVTYGSDYWPKTPEGQILCFFLALYTFAVFGYVTATLATFFIGQDATDKDSDIAGAKQIKELKGEIGKLRVEIRQALKDKN